MLAFFLHFRHGWPLNVVEVFFGIADSSLSRYFHEIRHSLVKTVVARTFFLPKASEIQPLIPEGFKSAFPGVFLIGDGLHINISAPESFYGNALTFSVYKSHSTFQFVICASVPCLPWL